MTGQGTPNNPPTQAGTPNNPPTQVGLWHREVVGKLGKWIVFSIIFALAPLIADGLNLLFHVADDKVFNWRGTINKGELLLVATAIAGAGAGELYEGGHNAPKVIKYLAGGGCILVAVLAAQAYTNIAADIRANTVYSVVRVQTVSLWFFWLAVIASIGCVLTAKE